MAASCRKPGCEHICFHQHSQGTGDLFPLSGKVGGMPVSLGSPPLDRHQHELPGRLIPQLSPWHRGGPGQPRLHWLWAARCTKAGGGGGARYRGAPGGGPDYWDPVTMAYRCSHAGLEPRPVGSLYGVNTSCQGPHPVPSSRGPPLCFTRHKSS